jgi:DNA repair and recombination RAD54-like protein
MVASGYRVPIPGFSGRVGFIPLGPGPRDVVNGPRHQPDALNALVLYEPKTDDEVHVVVDPILGEQLRPHQREGVRFMFDCVTGNRVGGYEGCILADDMGLGKTLQVVTLVWTMIKQSPIPNLGAIPNVVIVCPSSLTHNWKNELTKWLKASTPTILTVDGLSRTEMDAKLAEFATRPAINGGKKSETPILVISYDTFRLHVDALATGSIGLLVCDEGHRLKNRTNLNYLAFGEYEDFVRMPGTKKLNCFIYSIADDIDCRKRIILTGTPIQNTLQEYFSLIDFVNKGLLGTAEVYDH